MRDQLKQYVELLFAGAADAEEVKEEILQNTLERYDDLISQGKSPEAAYRLAIGGIGDVNEILGGAPAPVSGGTSAPVRERAAVEDPEDSANRKKMHAVAVAMYITCVVPVLVFSQFGLDTLGVVMMFVMVAAATALILMSRRDQPEDDRDDVEASNPLTPQQELKKTVNSIVNTLVLLAYLAISFITGAWYITWVIFPLSGAVKGLIRAVIDLKVSGGNAIARIILNIILILLMLGVLAAVMGFHTYGFIQNSQTITMSGEASFSPEEVEDISIEWAAGSVTIVCADTDEITVTESSTDPDAKALEYALNDGELCICYSKTALRFGTDSAAEKDLTITLPLDFACGSLRIDAAFADILVQELTLDALELNCASGVCTFSNCHAGHLDLDGAACEMDYTGTFDTMECSGADTEIRAYCLTVPEAIDVDGASASLDLTFPEDAGFCVDLDGMSCDFSSDFNTRQVDGCHVYGNEDCRINVSGMSANVCIRNSGHRHNENCDEDNSTCPDNGHHNGGHY